MENLLCPKTSLFQSESLLDQPVASKYDTIASFVSQIDDDLSEAVHTFSRDKILVFWSFTVTIYILFSLYLVITGNCVIWWCNENSKKEFEGVVSRGIKSQGLDELSSKLLAILYSEPNLLTLEELYYNGWV